MLLNSGQGWAQNNWLAGECCRISILRYLVILRFVWCFGFVSACEFQKQNGAWPILQCSLAILFWEWLLGYRFARLALAEVRKTAAGGGFAAVSSESFWEGAPKVACDFGRWNYFSAPVQIECRCWRWGDSWTGADSSWGCCSWRRASCPGLCSGARLELPVSRHSSARCARKANSRVHSLNYLKRSSYYRGLSVVACSVGNSFPAELCKARSDIRKGFKWISLFFF